MADLRRQLDEQEKRAAGSQALQQQYAKDAADFASAKIDALNQMVAQEQQKRAEAERTAAGATTEAARLALLHQQDVAARLAAEAAAKTGADRPVAPGTRH